jgi:hypothetical protein
VVGLVALGWLCARTSTWSGKGSYYIGVAEPLGMTAGEVRAAAAGDAALRARLVARAMEVADARPDLIGSATLGVATEGSMAGTRREMIGFGVVRWVQWADVWFYTSMRSKAESRSIPPRHGWRWSWKELRLSWDDVGAVYPYRFFWIDFSRLAAIACLIVIGGIAARRFVRAKRARVFVVLTAAILCVFWPATERSTLLSGSPGHLPLGLFRTMTPGGEGLAEEAARLAYGCADGEPMVVSWRTDMFADAERVAIGWPWAGAWVEVTDYPLSAVGAAGERTGLSVLEGAVVQARWISGDVLRGCNVRLVWIAAVIAPVLLLAGLPRLVWGVWCSRVVGRRRRTGRCVLCGYEVG